MIRRSVIPVFAALLGALSVPALAAPAAAQEWRGDRPCTAGRDAPLTFVGAAVAATVEGCAVSYCVTLPGGRRVCTCYGDGNEIRLEEAGRVVNRWPATWIGYQGEELDVLRGDLDGDGLEEIVVANLRTTSNGLGVDAWEVAVVDGRDPARAPVRIPVDDWGRDGSLVRPASGGACRLLATEWTPLNDPARGEGMYLVGQWMRYADGAWQHDDARPVVARRLLTSVRRDVPGAPFALLRHPRAEERTGRARFLLPPLYREQAGTLAALRADTLDVRLADGTMRRYAEGAGPGLTTPTAVAVLVDGATGRAYPSGYAPGNASALVGRPVRVRVYADGEGNEHHHLMVLGEALR